MMMFIGTETLVTQLMNERSKLKPATEAIREREVQSACKPECMQPDKIYIHCITYKRTLKHGSSL